MGWPSLFVRSCGLVLSSLFSHDSYILPTNVTIVTRWALRSPCCQ